MIALDLYTPDHTEPYTTAYVSRDASPEAIESIRAGWEGLLRAPVSVVVREAPEPELDAVVGI